MSTKFRNFRAITALTWAAPALVIAAARADVKIVSTVTITPIPVYTVPANTVPTSPAPNNGSGAAAAPTPLVYRYTTFYKGDKAYRVEDDGNGSGHTVIYDKGTDRVYTLDDAHKTYYETSFGDALNNGSGLAGNADDRLDIDTNLNIEEEKDAADWSRTIIGKDAKKFSFDGDITYSLKSRDEGGGGFGGGFGGGRGGGRGGGGGGGMRRGGGGQGTRPQMPTESIEGDVWLTDAATILPNGKKDEKELSVALLQQELPDSNPILKPLAQQLAKIKMLPLDSRVRTRFFGPSISPGSNDPNGGAYPPANTLTGANQQLIVYMEVKSIDTNVSVDDARFLIPVGYERVAAPAPIAPLPIPSGRSGSQP